MYNYNILNSIGDIVLILLGIGAIIFIISLIESMIYSKIQEIKFRRQQKKAINNIADKFQNQLTDVINNILNNDKDE